jgi:TrmH family RNA methyltransferase
VRSVSALSRRAGRTRQGRFLVEGPQGVREAVRYRPELVRDLYVTPSASRRYADEVATAHTAGLNVHEVSDEVLAAMADAASPQGLLAVCEVPVATLGTVLAGAPRLVCVLAHVRDPGNAGTVLRAADAVGADAVVVTDGSVDVFAPKVVRSTAGSLFHLPVVTGVPLHQVVEALRAARLRVLAADGGGSETLDEVHLGSPHAWVLGNEAWGLPADDRARCDAVVRIPIRGRAESLNLAMAATICLYTSATAQAGVPPSA